MLLMLNKAGYTITTEGRNLDINALNEMTGKKCTRMLIEVSYE